ncbi:MAG: TonB family protein [Bacteroidales bacterium]|nr:TonB family protein [Bacteroidales bacterium]
MGTFFAYILKTAMFLIVYYLFYKLLMSRETFHRFNRVALVSLLVLSFVLPLCESLVKGTGTGEGLVALEGMLMMATGLEDAEAAQIPTSHILLGALMLIYLLGVVAFTLRSLISYISLTKQLQKGERQTLNDGSILCLHEEQIAPFSWMHYIVASRKDIEESGVAILCHELGHIHNHHTFDLILTEVALILQWFNPAIWLMRRELQTIHEYEADEAVLDYGIDAKSYQLLLIKKAAGSRLQSITNSLHQSSIKKRITMMLKKKSNPWARAKYLLAVPVAALSVAVLSTPQASALSKEISECKVSEYFANHQISDQKNAPKVEIRTVSGTAEIDKDVIFFVDGKRVPSIDDINPENIDHMEVLKDKDAMAKFGITDAKGVILITTKSSGKTIHLKLDSVPSAKGEFHPAAEGEFHPAVIIVDPALPMVEDMPEYPGGMEAMMKFVAENLKYPEQMQKEKVEGRVLLSFVVEKDGSVTNIEEVQSPHPVLTEEAIRVVKLMPKWKPGKQDGKEVRVQFNLPITFRLN